MYKLNQLEFKNDEIQPPQSELTVDRLNFWQIIQNLTKNNYLHFRTKTRNFIEQKQESFTRVLQI